MADKKQRTPERQRQVESRASRMESTRNARNWDNSEANLSTGQRVRGMARASVAEAIGDKFGILGQRASDKIKGKTGPSIGQMAKAAGKEAIAEKFGPLGKIATMSRGDKKESNATKSKSDSATEKTSKQLTDIKNSNANNANMLRSMKGSLRAIDQKLEDILFSQERMENMLNRMMMDRKAPAFSGDTSQSYVPTQDNDPPDNGGGPNIDIDINRRGRGAKGRPTPRGAGGAARGAGLASRAGSFLGSAGRLAMGAGRLAMMANPYVLGATAIGGLGYLAYNAATSRKEKPEEAEKFDQTLKTGGARSQVIQGPEAERQQFADKPIPEKKLSPTELLKKFNLTQNDVVGIRGNIISLKDGRKIDTVQQTFVDIKDAAMAQSAIDQKTNPLPEERYDTGADFREAEVVTQDAAISSKDPREHLVAAVKSGRIKDFNTFQQGLRAAVSAAGIKDNIDIAISKLRFWAWKKVAEANGGKFSGSGPEFVEAFIKIYGGTPDTSNLNAEKSAIEEWKKSQAGEPETGVAQKQAPAGSETETSTAEPQPSAGENQAPSIPAPAAGGGATTPSAEGGATQAGPPSAVTPSAGGDKGATPRSGSEQSLLSAAKTAGIKDTELAQFMAQMSHESGNFKHLQEIWGPTSTQKRYEGRKDLGNTQPGDGYKFRGRGYVQLTGRANYRSFGQQIGVDLENNPDLASQPDIAAKLAIAYWNTRVKTKVRDFENTRLVTRLINGGFNGLSDREAKFKKYKEQKDLGAAGGAAGSAAPGAEGGGATSAPSPSAGGAGGPAAPGAGGMPGVDIMGGVTGMPQTGPGAGGPSGGPAGAGGAGPAGGAPGSTEGPPALAPPGSGPSGPAAEGAGTAAGDKSGQNGMLPPSSLAPVGVGSHKAQPVAADAFKAMRAAAAKDKVDLGITDSYRSYAAQVDVKRRKPNLAATPGKSNHGWGLAFDMSFGSNQNSPGYKWMVQNASKFGFKGPLQKPFEPWHWEYKGGGSPDAMAAAGAGGQKDAAPAGAEGAGATAAPSPAGGAGGGGGGGMPSEGASGGGAGGGGSMAAASPAGGGGGAPCPPAENTARPATTPVETGADLNRRSTDVELSKSSAQPPIVVAGGAGEKAGHTVPNGGGNAEGGAMSAVPQGGFAEQLASGIAGSLVESTGSNSMSMNRRAAGGSMVA